MENVERLFLDGTRKERLSKLFDCWRSTEIGFCSDMSITKVKLSTFSVIFENV